MTERLSGLLHRHRRIALDTSVFIYHVEGSTRYSRLADQIFAWLERPGHSAVTSTITAAELLVQPYRMSEPQRASAFYGLLTTFPNLEWVAPDLAVADLAAQVRAKYGLHTADAIQAATAERSAATLFVTNDRIFRRIRNFDSLILDDLL